MGYILHDEGTEILIDVVDTDKLEEDREARLRGYQTAMDEIQNQKEKSENA